jgi:capsular exopolysaccharide synthesis family protein
MSRMQNILDKAERDGAVLRIRPIAEQDPVERAGVAVAEAITMTSIGATAIATEPAIHTPVKTASPRRIDRALVAAHAPDTATASQYRSICTRILHADQATPVKVIMVTSPGTGEGKSVTAANLALTMAREYQRPTCLIDANLRHPKLQEMFGLPDGPGLIDVLAGRATIDQALTIVEPSGVAVLTAGKGPEHPAELLGTPMMRRTIDGLRAQFDRIVVDSPAALPMVDFGMMESLADRLVLVVRSGVTAKASIQDAMSTIDSTRLLGVVLNEAV